MKLTFEDFDIKIKQNENKILVLIDAANLESGVKNSPYKISYKKLADYFDCKINFYTASFGSQSHNSFLAFLKKKCNINLILKKLKFIKNENKAKELYNRSDYYIDINKLKDIICEPRAAIKTQKGHPTDDPLAVNR